MKQSYRARLLLSTWILDQVTPPTMPIELKRRPETYVPVGRLRMGATHHRDLKRRSYRRVKRLTAAAKEAWQDEAPEGTPDVDQATGELIPSQEHWLDERVKAWSSDYMHALQPAALQEQTPAELAATLDAVKPAGGLPGGRLDSLIRTMITVAIDDAQDDFGDDWGDVLTEAVWLTKDDDRVCPICEDFEGLTMDEVHAILPDAEPGLVHDVCRCVKAHRPKAFQELAGSAAVPGADPGAMVIRDPATGERMGSVLVTFHNWLQERNLTL